MSDLDKILSRIITIEARLDKVEADSHPPADLNAPVMRAMAAILRKAAESVDCG